jgi:GNAT superfamily N-acetyltransferase
MIRPKVRFYNHIPTKHITHILDYFTHCYGELRPAVECGAVVKVVVATYKGRVLGWGAVYHSLKQESPIEGRDYSLGVYVDERFRHRGLGGMIRRKAILWCLRQRKRVWWFRDAWKPTLATRDDLAYVEMPKHNPPTLLERWCDVEGIG